MTCRHCGKAMPDTPGDIAPLTCFPCLVRRLGDVSRPHALVADLVADGATEETAWKLVRAPLLSIGFAELEATE